MGTSAFPFSTCVDSVAVVVVVTVMYKHDGGGTRTQEA